MFLKGMTQLFLLYLIAVSVRKNVSSFAYLVLTIFRLIIFLFALFFFNALTEIPFLAFVDHIPCIQDMDFSLVDSSSLAPSFCGQKCKEVSLESGSPALFLTMYI